MQYRTVRRRLRLTASLAILIVAAAPARSEDADAVIRSLAAQDAAVITVGERLSVAARPLCADGGWAGGLVIQTATQYGADYRAAARRVLGIGDYPTVTYVVPGGAADRAGIRPGDGVTAIDSRALPSLARNRDDARMADTDAALDALDAGLADGVADIAAVRGGVRTTIRLQGMPACHARFEVRAGSDANASATRFRVQVSSDLVDPARADQDLAPLIAHELSHVILRHEEALRGKWGGLLPGFGKHGPALRASEIAADRLSTYLLALAGYRPADAVTYRTDFGKARSLGILSDRTHPDWRARAAAIQVEVARIEALRAAGEPIRPPADLMIIPSR